MKRSSSGSLQGEGKRRRVVEAEEGEVMETEEILMLRREHRAMYKRIRQKGEDVKSLTRELDTLRGRQVRPLCYLFSPCCLFLSGLRVPALI
jgi:hypothetical protein